MKSPKKLQVKTWVLLTLMVAFSSLGNVLLSMGMKQIGEIQRWSATVLAATFARILTSGTIWLGIGSLLLFFVFYLLVLSWADYSYVSPASATGYAVVPLLGYALLGEVVTSVRWAGVGLICLGVILVSRTSPNTTQMSTAKTRCSGATTKVAKDDHVHVHEHDHVHEHGDDQGLQQ
ncbi:MAG TPA: EamA family transporter [Acidobacteriota bacterium]